MKTRFVALAIAALFALGAGVSSAQVTPTPSPAPAATPAIAIPSLPPTGQIINDVLQAITGQVTGAYGYNPNRVHGTVTYFRHFDMQVRLQLDKYRNVHLHQGTVIDPRGWSIQQGQTVDVIGHPNADGSLEADSIVAH